MKIIEGMVLKEVAGNYMAVPTGEALKLFRGVVNLNSTGYDIWNCIDRGMSLEETALYLVDNYDGVTLEEAEKYTKEIIDKLVGEGIVIPD